MKSFDVKCLDKNPYSANARITHLAEIKNEKFVNEQKNAGRDHWQHRQTIRKTSRHESLDNFMLNLFHKPSQFAKLVVINMLARNVGSTATNVSIIEK